MMNVLGSLDDRNCEIIVGKRDAEGRPWCRTCEQHVRLTAPRQFFEEEGHRRECPLEVATPVPEDVR